MKSIVYTSSLPENLVRWLDKTSKKMKVSKKKIIVDALVSYKDELRKKELEEDFKRAAKDPEIQAMAEGGFEDFLIAYD